MKKKKQMKIILAIVVVIAVVLGSWVTMKPGGLSAEESDLQPSKPGKETKIAVQVSAPDLIQTYEDPTTGSKPADLPLTLKMSMSQVGIEGTSVKIPLTGFIPEGQTDDGQPYAGFTMTEPIYDKTPINLAEIKDHSMVKDAKVDGTHLVISFNTTKKTSFTLNIKFKFNNAYLAKIPGEHCVWNEAQAFVYAEGATSPEALSNKVTVKTDVPAFSVLPKLSNLTFNGQYYISGSIMFYFQFYSDPNFLKWNFIGEPEYTLYIDIPKGFELSSSFFKQDSTNPDINRYQYKSSGDFAEGNIKLTVPSNLVEGDKFTISYGVSCQKVNAGEINWELSSLTYTKQSHFFDFYVPSNVFRPSLNFGNKILVNMQSEEPSDFFDFSRSTGDTSAVKNSGSENVAGVSLVLSQPDNTPEKVNFNSFKSVGSVPIKAKFLIKNAADPSFNLNVSDDVVYRNGCFIPLPTLGENQYIDKIFVIPTNGAGDQDGILETGAYIGTMLSAIKWQDNIWPDGTHIDQIVSHPVKLSSVVNYQDENHTPITKPSGEIDVYYAPNKAIQGKVGLKSSAIGKEAGEIVSYVLESSLNFSNTLGNWVNPVVYIAVPKEMALVGSGNKVLEVGETLEGIRTALSNVASSSGTESFSKIKRLPSADNSYNYYSVATTATIEPNSREISKQWFQVSQTNLDFKVSTSAKKGTYPVPVVVATNQNEANGTGNNLFVQSVPTAQPMGNIADVLKDNPTLLRTMQTILGVNQNYTAFGASVSTPLTVLEGGGIDETTTFQTGDDVFWNNPTTGGTDVNSGTSVRFQSEFGNSSKTNTYDNVRLYYLLPNAADLAFTGLNADWLEDLTNAQKQGLEIYYTTAPAEGLVPYETAEVKDWYGGSGSDGDLGVLTGMGFEPWGNDLTTLPTDDPITGLYVTYAQQGSDPILPAEEMLDTVLDFEVPGKTSAPFNPTANLTYKYAVKSMDDGDIITNMSDTVQINTKTVINLTYDANLPTGAIGAPTGIPTNPDPIVVDDTEGTASYTIPTPAPTLPSYTFTGWQVKVKDTVITGEDGEPKVYQSGDELTLAASQGLKWTLVAQWEPNYTITVGALNFGNHQLPNAKIAEEQLYPTHDWTISFTNYALSVELTEQFTDEEGNKLIDNANGSNEIVLGFKYPKSKDDDGEEVDGKEITVPLDTPTELYEKDTTSDNLRTILFAENSKTGFFLNGAAINSNYKAGNIPNTGKDKSLEYTAELTFTLAQDGI